MAFLGSMPYWHLTNNGNEIGLIFSCQEEYEFGMNAVAMVSAEFRNVTIITYVVMSDHVHLILSGEREDVVKLFEALKRKLSNYFSRRGRHIEWEKFRIGEPIEIKDLQMLRNEIAYVNRNGFVAVAAETPFSYRWGSGNLYFNRIRHIDYGSFLKDMTYREKRLMLKSGDTAFPENWKVYKGVILPEYYCDITFGESVFRDGNHYFSAISKSFEAYSETAKRLSDRVFLSDSELYSAVLSEIWKRFAKKKTEQLSSTEKIEMARTMNSKYNASNEQIRRILNLDRAIISELFPQKVKGR